MLGGSQAQGAYCNMCASFSCHHLLGAQQNMNSQEYYNYMMRQAQQLGVASHGSAINIPSGNAVATHGIEVTLKKDTKINKKLLLLKR
jgi:uncharacterized ferredoxin-like protein